MRHWLFVYSLMWALSGVQCCLGVQDPIPPTNSPGPPDPEFSPKGIYTGPLELPHIVRFDALPMRMHLDPIIPFPAQYRRIDSRLIPLWIRMLNESGDREILETAAQSLARVAELKLNNIQSAGPALMKLATSTDDDVIRYACAKALASGDIREAAAELARMAGEATDSQRLLIEPALARWKSKEARDLWMPRLTDSEVSGISFRLAAEGLAAIDEKSAVEPLLKHVGDETLDYNKRMAAARCLAVLDPERAFLAASEPGSGDLLSRLLAVALLNSSKTESIAETVGFCLDESDAVASVAWTQTLERDPMRLLQHLDAGCQHRDAVVRMTAARVIRMFAEPDRVRKLHSLLSDVHLEVRNVARQMLLAIATEHAELRGQIVAEAGQMLVPDSKDWQGIEQSLVLLGQLHATEFSRACFNLLDYPRDEVGVSAAWLIQLSPDPSIYDDVRQYLERTETSFADGTAAADATPQRAAMLLQYAGLMRMKELQPLCAAQFSKSVQGGAIKRASGLWVLGLLNERNPDPDLASKFEARVKDRNSLPPEAVEVRRMSVMALGLMRSAASAEVVLEAYEIDSQESAIPGTARWVMPLLGEPMPADFRPFRMMIGGWRINAIGPEPENQ